MTIPVQAQQAKQFGQSNFILSSMLICGLSLILGCGGSASDDGAAFLNDAGPNNGSSNLERIRIDLKTTSISGNFLLNGQLLESVDADGQVSISQFATHEIPVSLGTLSEQSFDKIVLQGNYQLDYYHLLGNDVPVNNPATISSEISLFEPLVYDVDIKSVDIEIELSLNGESFPASPAALAHIYLQRVNDQQAIFALSNTGGNSVIKLVPGEYQIIYRYQYGEGIPKNSDFIFPETYQLNESQQINLEINSASMRIVFNNQNNDVVFDSDNIAEFYMRSPAAKLDTSLGLTEQETASIELIVGSYELIYSHQTGEQIPLNRLTKVADVSVTENGGVIHPSLAMISLEGRIFHNGQVPSDSGLDYADLYIQDKLGGEIIRLGQTYNLGFQELKLIPSDYLIIYDYKEGSSLPVNSMSTVIQNVSLFESGSFDIDIPSIEVQASVTLNGEAFPDSGLSFANISLMDDGDQLITLGATHSPLNPVRILSGDYQLVYQGREFQTTPVHTEFVVDSPFSLLENASFNHDFRAKTVKFETLVNGQTGVSNGLTFGNLFLQSEHERIAIGASYEQPELFLMFGEYDVYYEFREGSNVMPVNTYSKVQSVNIAE